MSNSEPYRISSSSIEMENESDFSHKPPIPDWWKALNPQKFPIQALLFRALCLISVARPSVDQYWQSFTDDDKWEKQQKRIINRLCNTNIVAGLVYSR
ncbi:hypothetical protein DEU56DRAFT_915083 [Suillus clintonianus]|uniref:uncharacterized protein n=1 Tax=Suillus clintonianus TaxID=1904413 RepID=UPI001B87B98C|nr:uncharacterized protein DEU56DRAFT_915083 [Suillus clintonianus]KAG2129594.1 hypothetical protein DEU56DRAFT_915083 [Suillus clintonianus]